MTVLHWYDRWLMVLIPIIVIAACAMPLEPTGSVDALWYARNVEIQLNVVPNFQEVWYKGHRYVILMNGRQGMLTHAGHCNGLHVTRIGGEQL